MAKIHISYLDEEDEDHEVQATPVVQLETPDQVPGPASRIPPPAAGHDWWTCPTQGCRVSGYSATATVVDKLVKKKQSCKRCKGAAKTEGGECDECGGRGWKRVEVRIRHQPGCPVCGSDMVPLPDPTGYPRLDLGERSGSDNMGGGKHVRWGWVPPTDG